MTAGVPGSSARRASGTWSSSGIALILMAGIPIWLSFLPDQIFNVQWVLLAMICLASVAYSVIQRRPWP